MKDYRLKSTLVVVSCLQFLIFHPFLISHCSADESEGKVNEEEKVAAGGEFMFRLDIENGHIGNVFFGCKDGATDGFDSRLDDMAPPPGMGGVGYTFLVSPDRKLNLYKDIRGCADTVQWLFYARIEKKPVKVSWNADPIPEVWDLFCGKWDGKSEDITTKYDCREETSIEIDRTGFIRFWVVRKNSRQ